MNKHLLRGALKTIKADLERARATNCSGCQEMAIARAFTLTNSLLNVMERDTEPQPVLVLRGDRFVARFTFVQIDEQEGA